MRPFVRTVLCCAGWLGLASALFAAPANITLSVHGEFLPGTSGATADNSPTTSSLSLRTATVSYDGSTVMALVKPGDVQPVSLGSLLTATGDLNPLAFDGSQLDLTVELVSPNGIPAFATLTADITGQVGVSGEVLTLTWKTPQTVSFTASDCVSKTITLSVEPSTTVVSGTAGPDIAGQLTVSYADPFLLGDVDNDGLVTFADAVRGLQICSGLDDGVCDQVEHGDVSDDGVLDLTDVVSIIRTAYSGL